MARKKEGAVRSLRSDQAKAVETARALLASPDFFNQFLRVVERAGLVGEQKNAVILLIIAVSRLLRRPLNAIVRGVSSAGKNFLVSTILRFAPPDRVVALDSSSERAWNYAQGAFRNAVVYLHERNEDSGPVHPMRILISEGRLVHWVSDWTDGRRVWRKIEEQGPVACISTTNRSLKVDDLTRHVSLWVDESAEQTRRIALAYTREEVELSEFELKVWQSAHTLLEGKANMKISFPAWFRQIADRVFTEDTAVRRYFPAFAEACRTIALIRSFQPERQVSPDGSLAVEFSDFAIAALLFDDVFIESLANQKGSALETRDAVRLISSERNGKPIGASDLANAKCISKQAAYKLLRQAAAANVIRRANGPQQRNRKVYLPSPIRRFVPNPKELFKIIEGAGARVRFVHPLTGKVVEYTRRNRQAVKKKQDINKSKGGNRRS
jgi:hypothetical protein